MAKETHIKTDKKTVGSSGAWELRKLKYINQIVVFFESYFYTRLTTGNDEVRRAKCRINAERSLRDKCSIWTA